MENGIVIWFNRQKGYGYIHAHRGGDLFFPAYATDKRARIKKGDCVSFKFAQGYKNLLASEVKKA